LMELGNKKPADVAYHCDITQTSISRILNNKQEPGAYTLYKLAKYLGKPMEWFITGEEAVQKTGGIHQHIRMSGEKETVYANINGDIGAVNEKSGQYTAVAERIARLIPQDRAMVLSLLDRLSGSPGI